MPQPLLKRHDPETMPPALRDAWQASMALRGDATLFAVFANHPALYDWYANGFYGTVFAGGRVPRRFKELLRIKLSTLHGCRFCNQGNRRDALAAGLTAAQIDALGDFEAGPFDDADKAVLRLADILALTTMTGTLTPDLYKALKAHFDDGQILELGLVGGVLAGMAKFLFAFDLVEKEETCPFTPTDKEANA
ncbi:MAG: carboxymuconolactone decarboxylase family protein [Alphaproteobacteria bacterium]|nr:MAG: carboxymuconolactone decarboxylase family protein [Alphaproteobacteria bacterium]